MPARRLGRRRPVLDEPERRELRDARVTVRDRRLRGPQLLLQAADALRPLVEVAEELVHDLAPAGRDPQPVEQRPPSRDLVLLRIELFLLRREDGRRLATASARSSRSAAERSTYRSSPASSRRRRPRRSPVSGSGTSRARRWIASATSSSSSETTPRRTRISPRRPFRSRRCSSSAASSCAGESARLSSRDVAEQYGTFGRRSPSSHVAAVLCQPAVSGRSSPVAGSITPTGYRESNEVA